MKEKTKEIWSLVLMFVGGITAIAALSVLAISETARRVYGICGTVFFVGFYANYLLARYFCRMFALNFLQALLATTVFALLWPICIIMPFFDQEARSIYQSFVHCWKILYLAIVKRRDQ